VEKTGITPTLILPHQGGGKSLAVNWMPRAEARGSLLIRIINSLKRTVGEITRQRKTERKGKNAGTGTKV